MKSYSFFSILLLSSILLSCNKVENKINKLIPENIPKNISIKNMVIDFKGDASIHEIKGIQIEDMFYKEYFVYTGNKKRIIDGINKIKSDNNFSSDCRLINKEEFNKQIVNNEKNKFTSFFWRFEKLKKTEIYTSIKGYNKHLIIFDISSDTVYHRVEEFKD